MCNRTPRDCELVAGSAVILAWEKWRIAIERHVDSSTKGLGSLIAEGAGVKHMV